MAGFDPTKKKDRLRGSPFEDQREERSCCGTVIDIQPETCTCRIRTDDGGIYDSLPLPGLVQDSQGGGGEVFVPRNGQRVEMKIGGQMGTRIRGYMAAPTPAIATESATPSIFPGETPTNTRGRINYRGKLPKGLVAGDWCRLGNQGQYIGLFEAGCATIFGSPWAQINAIGGTNQDTVNIRARRLNLQTGFGQMKVGSANGRHSIEFEGGLDQQAETGSNRRKYTYRGGFGVKEGYTLFSIVSRGGDQIYRVNLGYDNNYTEYFAGNHKTDVLGDMGVGVFGMYWRRSKADYLEIDGDQDQTIKGNRTCRINIDDKLQVMGNASVNVQNRRTIVCQTLGHNVTGSLTAKPGDSAYDLRVTNGSVNFEIGKPLLGPDLAGSSFNLKVFSPTGGINVHSVFGPIAIKSGLDIDVKSISQLNLTGSVQTVVGGGMVKLGGSTASEPAIKGNSFVAALQSFLTTVASASSGVATPPQAVSAINALGSAATSLAGQLAAKLSTKVFVS